MLLHLLKNDVPEKINDFQKINKKTTAQKRRRRSPRLRSNAALGALYFPSSSAADWPSHRLYAWLDQTEIMSQGEGRVGERAPCKPDDTPARAQCSRSVTPSGIAYRAHEADAEAHPNTKA
ncbi:hypothetical protein TKK_0009511 [Trichogramma kaykai]